MILQENDIPEIKAYLSKKYYFGDKWVGYESDTTLLTTKDLFCFRDLNREHHYHNGKYCKYQPIPTVLKALDPEKQDRELIINEKLLFAQVQQYPIRSFHAGTDLQAILKKGDLCPVIYRKVIDPEKDIQEYQVIQHVEGIVAFREPDVVSILQSFSTYKEAEKGLHAYISQCADYEPWERPDFHIIGVLNGQKTELNHQGIPLLNSALLITDAFPVVHSPYTIVNVQQPERPVIDHPMLAKFNRRTDELEFYNGNLQKVEPGNKKEYLLLSSFSIDPVIISQQQIQKVEAGQHLEDHKVDQKLGIKPKRNTL